METTQKIDYKQEATKLDQTEYFRPEIGTYEISVIHAGIKEFRVEELGSLEVKRQLWLKIRVGENLYNWTINKGKTKSSLWGQLMELGKDNEGLDGKKIILKITSTGKIYKGYPVKQYMVVMPESKKT